MSEIKSAFEIAMERINKMGEATEEDKLKWKYEPVGQQLAMKFVKGEADLSEELESVDPKGLVYVRKAIQEVLGGLVVLPVKDVVPKQLDKALEGLVIIKEDKATANQIASQIRQLMEQYVTNGAAQRKQASEMLKQTFSQKLRSAASQMSKSIDTDSLDVEALPQYREQLAELNGKINEQYQMYLTDFKNQLFALE